ncbi:hypothetical protein BZB76_6158 [Actinomadura pelletieri DSM 43383]|uniref:Uncharacterized protein n=2 Tax=Actinomadura pelletieri TaxID=111805 RepID=A0A495QBF5_9ACTN|nr:hypothetical protein BZB76_6158 [Actinomadura pelletieri DSM 43383]
MGGPGRLFRRDRLTGRMAVGLVGALGIADVGARPSARGKGLAVHGNGLAGKVDGEVGVIPRILGAEVYFPDETAGALIVYDAAADRFQAPIPVTGRPAKLDVFVRDGLLRANDRSGPRAVVIARQGAQRGVDKYRDGVADGPRRTTIPLPGDGNAPPPPGASRTVAAARGAADRAVQRDDHAGRGSVHLHPEGR